MKFAMSYSFGKDSALALWRLLQAGHQPVCLIVTVNQQAGRSWFHGVDFTTIDRVSASLGIPCIKCLCQGDTYHTAFEQCLGQARHMGAEACAFGDININGHLEWNRSRCKAAGLECLLPLWQESREAVVYQLIDEGFQAVIKCVQTAFLDQSFLGLTLNRDVIKRIRATGADICGENGEYHTFVYGGPTFQKPVSIAIGEIIKFDSHSAIDITVK